MELPAAFEVALMLLERPASVRWASRIPLPSGVTLLLEVAAGEPSSQKSLHMVSSRSPEVLLSAATFFIEQVLFTHQADSYRILGCQPTSTRRQLRRHMALLVKWLHPDCHERYANEVLVDRSVFVHRVTQAWGNLKNSEQRAAYDRSLKDASYRNGGQPVPRYMPVKVNWERAIISSVASNKSKQPHLVMQQVEADNLFSRLFHYLRRQP